MNRRSVAAAAIAALALPLPLWNATAGAAPIASSLTPATAGQQAERDIAFTPDASCDVDTARLLSSRHTTVRQFVIVASETWASTTASVQIVARSSTGEWRCQRPAVTGRVGRSGTRPLLERRSGDGTTPAGVFPLGSVQAWDGQQFEFFGNRPDPGVRGRYRVVRAEDCWGATPGTASYQAVVNAPRCADPDEWLSRFGDVYRHAAIIGANLTPISGNAPGEVALAAAIFLHRNAYAANGASQPTSGCVSLTEEDLELAVRLIDPALDVRFAIGPLSWLRESA